LKRIRKEDEAGKERHCSLEGNTLERKITVSDKVLKHQFQIELEVTKGLLTQ